MHTHPLTWSAPSPPSRLRSGGLLKEGDLMAIDELRSLFVFDGLSDEQLRELDDASTVVSFDGGEGLFHRGGPRRGAGRGGSVIPTRDRRGLGAGGFMAWPDWVGSLTTARATDPGRIL